MLPENGARLHWWPKDVHTTVKDIATPPIPDPEPEPALTATKANEVVCDHFVYSLSDSHIERSHYSQGKIYFEVLTNMPISLSSINRGCRLANSD